MDYKQIKVTCDTADLDEVTAVMSMTDNGLMIEDYSDIEETFKDVYADLIDDELLKMDKTKSSVSVFISEERNPEESVYFIRERLAALALKCRLEVIDVSDDDWANSWKKYYHPIKVGDRIVIVPAWEKYEPKENELPLIMDPGMAFGAGTHETTRLVMTLIEKYVKPGESVLDIGTGSGILSISASLLGAGKINAYDIDPTAVRIAAENAKINKCENISANVSDLLSSVERGQYDLICANIVADIIIRMSPDLYKFAHEGTIFIASGILVERREEVLDAMSKTPFVPVEASEENGWCALVFRYGKTE